MRAVILSVVLSVTLVPVPTVAGAGILERACLSSERGGDRAICGCIQRAADRTLTGRDQRTAARFFRDPDKAQEVRMSKRTADRQFWERYEAFGYFAEVSCASN